MRNIPLGKIVDSANGGEKSALLGAFTDRIRHNLRAKLVADIQPMVDAVIDEAVKVAIDEMGVTIRAMATHEMNDLTILLKVGDREPVKAHAP
jgi:hypothetical protein